jgi:hypothetical protein
LQYLLEEPSSRIKPSYLGSKRQASACAKSQTVGAKGNAQVHELKGRLMRSRLGCLRDQLAKPIGIGQDECTSAALDEAR